MKTHNIKIKNEHTITERMYVLDNVRSNWGHVSVLRGRRVKGIAENEDMALTPLESS